MLETWDKFNLTVGWLLRFPETMFTLLTNLLAYSVSFCSPSVVSDIKLMSSANQRPVCHINSDLSFRSQEPIFSLLPVLNGTGLVRMYNLVQLIWLFWTNPSVVDLFSQLLHICHIVLDESDELFLHFMGSQTLPQPFSSKADKSLPKIYQVEVTYLILF